MKVVLVNHSDSLGGASVVTYRLMEALIAQGVDARMLVVKKSTGSPYVAEAAGRFAEQDGVPCRTYAHIHA